MHDKGFAKLLLLGLGLALATSACSGHETDVAAIAETTNALTADDRFDGAPDSTGDIAEQLQSIPGMVAYELGDPPPDYRWFILYFDQPVDHDDPESPRFEQRMLLFHRSIDAPMVLNTQGYSLSGGFREPAAVLGANQLSVEHRFFGGSFPEDVDYDKLTIEQAAADHHRIVEAIKPLYDQAWISTGVSKGGMTSMYHRRFYPDDVDATIPYVAPNSYGQLDRRYVRFLDRVGDRSCRDSLETLQRETLLRRDAMRGLAEQWGELYGLTFSLDGGIDHAIDIMVGEFFFGFWQYSDPERCDDIPSSDASDQEIFDFVNGNFTLYYASDFGIQFFQSYYYQAVKQLGYPRLPTRHIDDLLLHDPNDYSAYTPVEVPRQDFDWGAMFDIQLWAAFEGESIMFIYGEYDPWTAGAYGILPWNHRDTHLFTAPRANHSANIAQLGDADRGEALEILEGWTGVTPIDPGASVPLAAERVQAGSRSTSEAAMNRALRDEGIEVQPFPFRL